jgi:ribosomal protein S18 acetylase RimI-like enzyme
MGPEVRAATLADRDRLGELWAEADALHHAALPHVFAPPADPARTAQDVAGILGDPSQHLLVAQVEVRLVGLVHVTLRERYPPMVAKRFAVVEAVVVATEDRGAGVGKVLMAAAEHWARDRGADEIWLDVWEFNDAAVGFYEALGYETVSRRMRRGITG